MSNPSSDDSQAAATEAALVEEVLRQILASRVYDVARETPLDVAA